MSTNTENYAEQQALAYLKDITAAHAEWLACEDQQERDSLQEAIERRMVELPLDIEVRDGWRSVGGQPSAAEEFRLLLSAGGPATQIYGALDGSGQPSDLELQFQDWGTPWTRLNMYMAFLKETPATSEIISERTEAAQAALEWFVGLFCFEE